MHVKIMLTEEECRFIDHPPWWYRVARVLPWIGTPFMVLPFFMLMLVQRTPGMPVWIAFWYLGMIGVGLLVLLISAMVQVAYLRKRSRIERRGQDRARAFVP